MTPGPAVELGIEGIADATRIGEGRSGTVYRAKEGVLERTVAVKVLRGEALDEQACRALAGVSGHPHVAGLYAWGRTSDGRPYLVQEYLAGGTLAERLEEFGPMPWEEVAEIGVKLAGALAAAHGAGVLHGDVRPENVLISSFDEPKLSDFGLAGAGSRAGSSVHAAPEVLSGRPATEASDVYSLASTLYALAAGHSPFASPDEARSKAPPDLRGQGVPAPMWAALAAALGKDPSARTSSARAFGDALRGAQRAGGQTATRMVVPDPVVIAPARRPEAPTRRARRARPALLGALVVAIVALLAAGALAVTRVGDDDDREQVALTATTTTVVPTTAATAPPAPPVPTTTPPSTGTPAPTATTRPASAPTTTASPPATTSPAGGIPACNPSFFRATVTSDRPRYDNGDTVTVSARFENVSGRPCSYSQTGTSSQLLNPFGDPMGPIRTLVGDNVDNVPFEPGTSQTFRSSWEVNTCVSQTTCYPGRYTITVNVVPFGGGQASFDVT
ncbi:MAG TPA: serine/threonine-protein kinase [Acidimicrobiales bacterium]|nr:serine/threonine-protein kinase [Acidimicrobiales bacterium]